MQAKYDYYMTNYEKVATLSESDKCCAYIMRNIDTNQFVVKKILDISKLNMYRILQCIDSVHMAKIYAVFDIENKCIVIEEYISGKSLFDIVNSNGALSEESAGKYIINLCDILTEVHSHNIVHRDIQPKNVLISADGVLKLIDFDISREIKNEAGKDTTILGTVGYAAPEQFGFKQTDGRTDIYALGVLLKYMLSGNENAVYTDKYQPIIEKATQIDPENRYSTAGEMKKAIIKIYSDDLENKNSDVKTLGKVKNIISTIPGFMTGNIIISLFASVVYCFLIYCMVDSICKKEYPLYRNIIESICWICTFFVPYAYLANIGHIVNHFPKKKKYKNIWIRILFQIAYAAISFVLLASLTCIIDMM